VRFPCNLALCLVVAASAFGQVKIDVQPTDDIRYPIAVPPFATAPGMEKLGQELARAVSYDLDFSGQFVLLPPESYPAGFTGFTKDVKQVDFAAWRETRIDFLVHVYVTKENTADGEKIVLLCRLLDVFGTQQVVGRRIDAGPKWARWAAHKFSDIIVQSATGIPGVAASQICFSVGATGNKDIYISDYDGANVRQVTKHESISILPKFSPDGKKIAYVSYKDRYPFLYVLDVETGKSIAVSKQVGVNMAPAWSPDGRRLALVLSKDANQEIYIMNADGSDKQRITTHAEMDTSPTFSPDGGRIAFVSERAGSPQIFVMSADGKNPARVSYQGGRSYDPEWSPDGKRIAYVAEKRGEGLEIYVMDADGKNPRRLTDSSGSNESPSWSADSRHIMFASTRSGGSELWTVNVETGRNLRVPGVNARAQGPNWGPVLEW
jgi:TolB protein